MHSYTYGAQLHHVDECKWQTIFDKSHSLLILLNQARQTQNTAGRRCFEAKKVVCGPHLENF